MKGLLKFVAALAIGLLIAIITAPLAYLIGWTVAWLLYLHDTDSSRGGSFLCFMLLVWPVLWFLGVYMAGKIERQYYRWRDRPGFPVETDAELCPHKQVDKNRSI
jgi:hypothetical protein